MIIIIITNHFVEDAGHRINRIDCYITEPNENLKENLENLQVKFFYTLLSLSILIINYFYCYFLSQEALLFFDSFLNFHHKKLKPKTIIILIKELLDFLFVLKILFAFCQYCTGFFFIF